MTWYLRGLSPGAGQMSVGKIYRVPALEVYALLGWRREVSHQMSEHLGDIVL